MIKLFITLKPLLINIAAGTTGEKFMNDSTGYLIGGIIAILLLGYLAYTLLKPEKF